MNDVSIIPAPVAAQISGPGSFFGSCQIASGNFEDILSSMSEDIMPDVVPAELPATNNNSENLAEQPATLGFDFQDFNKSEVLMQLQQILGEDAGTEAFKRIINLLEKGTLSVQADTIDWDKDTFEELTLSLLERLDLAIKQIAKISGDEQNNYVQNNDAQEHENENNFDIEKFLNLLGDLLKVGLITPEEYETVLKNPEESSLPELLGELKKEATELVEKLENVETEQIEQPRYAGEPKQVEQPKHQVEQPRRQAEQPRQVENPKQQAEEPRQTEQLWRAERPRQTEEPRQVEQPKQTEQPKQAEQLGQVEQPIQVEHYKKFEGARQAEQPKQQGEQLWQAEIFRQVKQFLQSEEPIRARQFSQVEQLGQVEQSIYAERSNLAQAEQEPLLEELRVISTEMEMGTQPKDKAKFYELINNLLEKGLINEQDLKNVVKMPETIDDESSSPIEPISKNEKNEKNNSEKIEPVVIKNAFEKIWTNIESENKAEKRNIFSKFREIVESRSIITSGEKIDFKHAKVEVEVRAVWDAGDLKIETVNPKTGEKLQSVPVANSHRMQERIHEFEVVRQVVAQAKFITTPTGEQKLTMQLRPEHLGQMNLRIVLNNGEMQIHARVESITAQAALESHIGLLREGLEKQGINLDRLEVSVEQRDRQDAFSLAERHEQHEKHGKGRHHHQNKEMHLAVSVKNDENSDTGRRLGYNTMEYLA